MGQSRVVKRKKFKLIQEPVRWEPNSMYYIRPTIDDDVKIYITDINGVPFEVEGDSSSGSIELIRNTDGNLAISGQTVVTINISQTLLDSINSKLSSGDSISQLVNDEGYIKLIDIPITKILVNNTEVPILNNEVNISVPVNTSELNNDSGFITDISGKLDKVQTITSDAQVYVKNEDGTQGMLNISQLGGISDIKQNGVSLPITSGSVNITTPTNTSDLNNDSGFITASDLPAFDDKIEVIKRNGTSLPIVNKEVDVNVPTKTSELTNDSDFITSSDIPSFDDKIEVIKRNGVEVPIINKEVNIIVPTKTSELVNDSNFTTITKHSELVLDDGTNPHGTTKANIGLSNVDNTSDLNKPISTATQNALNDKLDKNTSVTTDTMMYVKNPDGSQGITKLQGEYYIFNSTISVMAAATPSYHYRAGSTMNLNLSTASGLTSPADLVGVLSLIPDVQLPYNCKLVNVNMILPNIDSLSLSLLNYSSLNPNLSVNTLKYTFNGTLVSNFYTINQNTEALNLTFTEFNGVKLFCMASSTTPAAKGGYIQLKFKKI